MKNIRDSKTHLIKFSEQLKGFTVVDLDLDTVSKLMIECQKRYGEVFQTSFCGIDSAIDFLCPLKSFTTRYVAIELDSWTCLLTDMVGENCFVNGYALSRITGCRVFSINMRELKRELQVCENGIRIREIQSIDDGDRWYFSEGGNIMWFENKSNIDSRTKKNRLQPETLKTYFNLYTGMEIPVWNNLKSNNGVGIQRSVREVYADIEQYPTSKE